MDPLMDKEEYEAGDPAHDGELAAVFHASIAAFHINKQGEGTLTLAIKKDDLQEVINLYDIPNIMRKYEVKAPDKVEIDAALQALLDGTI